MESLEPCPEATDISVTSKKNNTIEKDEEKEEEEEKDEEEYGTKHKTTSRAVLDLELADNELINKRNPNPKLHGLNLFNSLNPSGSIEGSNPKPSKSKTFTCSFCWREFSTSQALGGHQNAHKQERAQAKHRHNMAELTAAVPGAPPPLYGHQLRGYSYYPYSTLHEQLSFRGGFNRVRTQSHMNQKPYSYHHSSSPYCLAREKMPRAYLIDPSTSSSTTPDYDLKMENFQSRLLGADKFNFGVINPNSSTKTNEGDDFRLRLGNVDDGNYASGLDLDLKL